MHNQKVLITGTTGMLGKHFLELFGGKYDVYTLNRSDGDLFDFEFVTEYIQQINPDIIIHCIADTNLPRCEKNKKNTLMLHCGLTDCLSSHKSRFIYISSDSCKNPINFYSKTKWLGEKIACLNDQKSVILRTNIYGFNSSEGNSLCEWAMNNFKHNKKITGFTDVMFNAIYTKQLVNITEKIMNKDEITGYIDVGGDYSISKFDFLKKVCDILGYKDLVEEGKLSGLNDNVKRPKSTLLDNTLLEKDFNITIPLEEGLIQFKKDMGM
jgi:dTDP-4-dehydrorhamnose reductase